MNLLAFSLYDTKALYFSPPFFMALRGQAVRAIIDLGTDLNTQVGRNPADFILYEIGTFNSDTGSLLSETPVSLGPVLSYLPSQKPLFAEAAQ